MPPPKPQTLETIAHTVQGYAAVSVNGFAPEIILGVGFLLAILLDAVTRKAPSKRFAVFFAAIVLAVSGVYAALQWHAFDPLHARQWQSGFLVFPYSQNLFSPTSQNGLLIHGYAMAVVDNFSIFFKLLISLAGIVVLMMSLFSRKLKEQPQRLGEYSSLILGMSIGLYLMPSSTDLIMMYVSLELASIAGYLLAGFFRKSEHGAEASLKYILFGALSSGLMIYGISLFYGLAGTTNIFAIHQIFTLNPDTHTGPNVYLLWTATLLVLVGIGYKISAVPFHFWTPDVYEGAPIPVTALLSVASKAAGFGMLIRFLVFVFPDSAKTGALIDWHTALAVGSVLTMTFGNFAALLQSNVRRMLAYSTIAHSGYMLAALATGKAEGIVAIMIYLTAYLFMQLGAFYIVMLIENKIGSEEIDDYRGLMLRAPLVCSALVIFLASLTGIPLTAGFVGKFYLLTTLLTPDAHFHTMPWLWLGIVVILNSVISLYYYLRVAAAMFLRRPIGAYTIERMSGEAPSPEAIRYGIPVMTLLLILIVPVIALGIYFQPLVDLASGVVQMFLLR